MENQRLVAHLDLKGFHYHPEYYPEYFRNLGDLGYTAVLVEYEDVLPFVSSSVSNRVDETWSASFHKAFLQHAAEAGVEVIPLQQCLGHLEYAFRVPANRRFSIPGGDFRDLNPELSEAREWLKALLAEVLEAHPSSRYIHLGMDEASGFVEYAKTLGQDPMGMFLDYLEELCNLCESYGKKPLIWSDMLEDHIAGANLARLLSFRERVILVPWNYGEGVRPQSVVRFAGLRYSRQWLENPQGGPPTATPLPATPLYFEDWEPEIKALSDDFRASPWLMEPLFQAGIWKRLGFTVWGAAGGSCTQDRSLLPYYHWRIANIREWQQAVQRYQLEGLIITHWQRSNSFTVPNVIPDLVWPILAKAANREQGAAAFFPDVDRVDHLFFKIGKCREDWMIEASLIDEMERQQPSLHQYEWRTTRLLLEVHQIHRGIEEREEQIGCYAGVGRLNPEGWKVHADLLCKLGMQLQAAHPKVREHLEKRYRGEALEEWLYRVFLLPLETLDRLKQVVQRDVLLEEQRQAGVKVRAFSH